MLEFYECMVLSQVLTLGGIQNLMLKMLLFLILVVLFFEMLPFVAFNWIVDI